MTDQHRTDETEPARTNAAVPADKSPVDAPVSGEATPVKKLTPEEQMALFEKDLKENDWGHQPC